MATAQRKTRRRLIVCMDGTWNDGINSDNPLTNVARFARCVGAGNYEDEDGVQIIQITFYLTGIGTGTSFRANVKDAIFGRGIHKDIKEAYTFICLNYEHKEDEIVLVGFSRGAFAARALSFLLDKLGVLRKAGLKHLGVLYEKWKASYQTHGNADADAEWSTMRDTLEQKKLLLKHPRITACAMWDTVAALPKDELSFVDEKIPKIVGLAVHALALNEQRTQYAPLLWHQDEGPTNPTRLHQCWFLGSHSDVGGGNKYPDLANITFAWVISYLQDLVGFSEDAIFDITQNFQTDLDLDPPKMSIRTKGDCHFELSFHLPVDEFQSKTDTHVDWLAWAQRGAGSSYRNALLSGDSTQERVHWSVQRLLEKKIVSTCYPLELVPEHIRIERIEKPRRFEREILAIWIARQCQEALRVVVSHTQISLGIIPIYAVLWPLGEEDERNATDEQVKDPWSVVTEAADGPPISVKVCGEVDIVLNRTAKNGHAADTLKVVYLADPFTKNARLGRWIGFRRSIPTLQGQISIPFTPEGN